MSASNASSAPAFATPAFAAARTPSRSRSASMRRPPRARASRPRAPRARSSPPSSPATPRARARRRSASARCASPATGRAPSPPRARRPARAPAARRRALPVPQSIRSASRGSPAAMRGRREQERLLRPVARRRIHGGDAERAAPRRRADRRRVRVERRAVLVRGVDLDGVVVLSPSRRARRGAARPSVTVDAREAGRRRRRRARMARRRTSVPPARRIAAPCARRTTPIACARGTSTSTTTSRTPGPRALGRQIDAAPVRRPRRAGGPRRRRRRRARTPARGARPRRRAGPRSSTPRDRRPRRSARGRPPRARSPLAARCFSASAASPRRCAMREQRPRDEPARERTVGARPGTASARSTPPSPVRHASAASLCASAERRHRARGPARRATPRRAGTCHGSPSALAASRSDVDGSASRRPHADRPVASRRERLRERRRRDPRAARVRTVRPEARRTRRAPATASGEPGAEARASSRTSRRDRGGGGLEAHRLVHQRVDALHPRAPRGYFSTEMVLWSKTIVRLTTTACGSRRVAARSRGARARTARRSRRRRAGSAPKRQPFGRQRRGSSASPGAAPCCDGSHTGQRALHERRELRRRRLRGESGTDELRPLVAREAVGLRALPPHLGRARSAGRPGSRRSCRPPPSGTTARRGAPRPTARARPPRVRFVRSQNALVAACALLARRARARPSASSLIVQLASSAVIVGRARRAAARSPRARRGAAPPRARPSTAAARGATAGSSRRGTSRRAAPGGTRCRDRRAGSPRLARARSTAARSGASAPSPPAPRCRPTLSSVMRSIALSSQSPSRRARSCCGRFGSHHSPLT